MPTASWRWNGLRAAALAVAILLAAPAWAGGAALEKDQAQAAYLVNFAKFTEWAPGTFEHRAAMLVIGVAGQAGVADALGVAQHRLRIHDCAVLVVRLESPQAMPPVHVLYLGAAEDGRLGEWLAAIAGRPVLTVGESAEFSRHGGMVTLVQEYDRLRFELNVYSAERAGLTISAQVQRLAKSVVRGPRT
ncbi:MAG: YfiR family protein [Gammaproteobacteria bacterium]|nr:YfiR family protein [Gammaproteobacteria bacterium]